MKRFFFLIWPWLFPLTLQAQSPQHRIDSLLVVLETAKEDTGKVNTLNELTWQLRNTGNAEHARLYADTALSLATNLGFKKGLGRAYSNLGVLEYDKGHYPDALKNHTEASRIREEIGDKAGLANSYNNIGIIYGDQGQYQEALKNHSAALKIREEIGNRRGQATSNNNIGTIYFHQGQYPEALKNYKAALPIFESFGDKRGVAACYTNIGIISGYQGDIPAALKNHQASLQLSKAIGDKKAIYGTYVNIGVIQNNLGHLDSALLCYTAALGVIEELGDKKGMAGVYNNIGILYDNQGNYPEALKYYQSAIKLKEELGDKNGVAATLTNMGTIYEKEGNDTEALNYYATALKTAEEIGDKQGAGLCYGNIGNILNAHGHREEALNNLFKALKLSEEIGLKSQTASANLNIGTVLVDQGKYQESLQFYQKALTLFEEMDNQEGRAQCHINMGSIYTHLGAHANSQEAGSDYEEAIHQIENGLALAKAIDAKNLVKDGYKFLSEVYAKLGAFQKALEYSNLYSALKDSLLNNESTRKLEQLRTEYEVEKAVTTEKVKQDSLLAEQKFLSAKEQAEINARHELAIAEARAQKQKAIEVANIRYQMALSEARTEQEKQLAEQKFQSELKLAEENSRHQLALADEKAKEEKERAKRRVNSEKIMGGVGVFGLIALFFLLYNRQRNLKRKAIEKAETQHKMAELELQSLRAQLNPHFMFNSLNAIQELILMEENDRSHTYLARFAKLLRMLLENANNPFIPLAREIEFLQLYLSLENLRIPDLKYSIEVDPGINPEQIKIPNMILQPYIENAIWHGLSHKQGGDRKIIIRVQQDSIGVKYEIEDNGVGRKRAEELKSVYRKEHRSKGMELLTKRFKLLNEEYRSHIETRIEDIEQNQLATGTKVAILVPWDLASNLKQTA